MIKKIIKIIGLGANFPLRDFMGFWISRLAPDFYLELIDGGTYKPRHVDHELFTELGKKVTVSKKILQRNFPNLKNIGAIPFYIGEKRSKDFKLAGDLIHDGDIIFLCVDNDLTKKIILKQCRWLKNVVIVIGGVDGVDVHILIYIKIRGVEITPNPISYDPFIMNPNDQLPAGSDNEECLDEAAKQKPNIFSINIACALMAGAFYSILAHLEKEIIDQFDTQEIYFNVKKLKMRTVTHQKSLKEA